VVEAVARRASSWLDDLRAASVAAINGGPLSVVPIVLATLLVACSLAVLILTVVPSSGSQPALNLWVRGAAAGICALIGLGYLAYWARPARAARLRGPAASDEGVVSILLSAGVLFLLLLIPAYLLAARTHAPTEQWIGYGFFDKRWVPATFLLGTIGAMIVMSATALVVRGAAVAPPSWREWARAAYTSPAAPAPGVTPAAITLRRALAIGAGVALLGAYFYAPPWHVSLSGVNIHETPMMAGVQGIANGATPYIGSGAVQYGPGSELIHYLYLHTFGFNIENFRQSTILLYWLAATIFFTVLFVRLPWKLALLISLLSVLLFPTLQMVSFQQNGAIDASIDRLKDSAHGVWGWPNAMRYIGVFTVAMLFPAIAAMRRERRARNWAVALGVVFGLTCYISQENLIGGIIALGALAILLVTSETVPARTVGRTALAATAGFFAVVAVVFAYYLVNGELIRFIQLYYLIPPAVAAGYSDTVFYGGFGGQWGHFYYLMPFFLGALSVLSVVRLQPFRIARQWSRERVLLVSALVATCVAFTGAFLRSDSSHLVNTLLALPVALVLAVAFLPRLLGIRSGRRRLAMAAALALIPLAMLPLGQITNIGSRITAPVQRFSYHDQSIQWQRAEPTSIAARRLGPVLHTPEQWCCTYFRYPVSMREFAGILDRLHEVVGDRRVYVANFIDGMEPGAAYFLADLNPATTYLEPFTMVMNQRLLNDFLAYFRDHLSDVQAIVAVYPNLPEVQMFEHAYPNFQRTEIAYTWGTITVLTRD
jgi:hypothetical protein